MPRRLSGYRTTTLGAALTFLILLLSLAAPSSAAGSGRIDHVQADDGIIGVLYSIPGLAQAVEPDLTSLRVTVNGKQVDATAELASDSKVETSIRRTAILAIDVSNSMRGERFSEAKLAAKAFIDGVPPDVYVGIVAFAGDVTTEQEPTLDRAASAQVVDKLTLSLQTRLYDGVLQAIRTAGPEGQLSILVLSDGTDTSDTPLRNVTAAIKDADARVDVVTLSKGTAAKASLDSLARAGAGSVLSAEDPSALTELFSAEAQTLAKQLFITVHLPPAIAVEEGTLAVSAEAGGETYADTAFVTLRTQKVGANEASTPRAVPGPQVAVSKSLMLIGLGVTGVALLVLMLGAFGVFGNSKQQSVEDRISVYLRSGGERGPGSAKSHSKPTGRPEGLAGSALGIAEKALASNKDFSASVGSRLEAAGMSLKPAEWLLMHAGIAFCAAFVGFLMSSGGLLWMFLFLLGGFALPWFYLGFKRARRLKAFNGQLADTMQLMAGSLSAGLSFAQSVNTVVSEGSEPMTAEFKRSLMEARLGAPIEDALESVAERMQSEDFKWVVMAVRIQREVGGNLAEVLTQVAATIRERAYLKRQVKSLSAEGLLSAYILGGLPIAMFAYLLWARPEYVHPLLSTLVGWALLGVSAVMMTIGAFWMSRIVKIEV